jgi:hypothetical protein
MRLQIQNDYIKLVVILTLKLNIYLLECNVCNKGPVYTLFNDLQQRINYF